LEDRLSPATLTVNSSADTANASDHYLSLREAFALFNSPTLPNDLSAEIQGQISGPLHGGGSDTIVFDHTTVTTAITLGGGQLSLTLPGSTARVTIDGGAGVTLDGNSATRVLHIQTGADVTLNHLTITRGVAVHDDGGGIWNQGTLTVNSCTFSSNYGPGVSQSGRAGGILNSGTLTVTDSTFSGNGASDGGGAIDNGGTATVTDCTITGSYAGFEGSGIFNSGTMTVSSSTLRGNSGPYSGGGIYNHSGTMTVTNCTLSANSSSINGGGIFNESTLTLHGCTLFANNTRGVGGGIENQGTLTVSGCTLSANSASGAVGGIDNANGLVLYVQDSIVAGNHGSSAADIYGSYNQTHSLVGGNPLLAPLGYYGGPTQTCPLLPGSPALGAGDPAVTGTDQRGQPRPGPGNDIGAFQTQAHPFEISTLTDPGRLSAQLSLREAVNLASVLPGSNSVTFAPGLVSGTVTLNAGPLLLNHNLIIAGLRAGPVTVSGNNASRVFDVAAGASITLASLIVTNGRVSSDTQAQGGGIRNAGNLTLNGCTITNNQVTAGLTGTGSEVVLAQGGGIYSTGGLTLTGCIVSGNSANLSAGNLYAGNDNGGGIYNNGGTVGLNSCTVSGNSVNATFTGGAGVVFGYGGGLTSDNGTLSLTGCTVSGNSARGGNSAGFGGGIHSFQSIVSLSNCTIAGNTATSTGDAGFGGGVSGLDTSMTLTSCTITGNSASSASSTGSGGGLYYNSSVGSAQVLNSIVAGNSSGSDGPDASGSFSSLGYNLIGISDGSAGWGGSDLTGTAGSPLDPMLGTLGYHGGPTWTIPLLAGSPALDAGDPAQLGTYDQRGAVRTGGVNIGAFQASAAAVVVVGPTTTSAGLAFDVSVAVYDAFGQLAVGYTGTIHFSSSDNNPNVVLPQDTTFGLGDSGMVTFSGGVTLFTPGSQTLTATDLASGISGSTIVML
jgi:hypothetical protein